MVIVLTALDENLKTLGTIDKYVSLIWTDRYQGWGDFELKMEEEREGFSFIDKINTGHYLMNSESDKLMEIESITKDMDGNEKGIMVVKGRSVEKIFEDRVILYDPSLYVDGNVGDWTGAVINQTIRETCGLETSSSTYISSGDLFPKLFFSASYPQGNETVSQWVGPQTLYDRVMELCELESFGYKIYPYDLQTNPKLFFKLYEGVDRSKDQDVNSKVVFDISLDNLSEARFLKSTENLKNVAYVFVDKERIEWPSGVTPYHYIVYPASATPSGLNRRVLLLDSSDIKYGSSDFFFRSSVNAMARKELKKRKLITLFDGEIPQTSQYVYGTDYKLGDIVSIGLSVLSENRVRISEWIWSVDDSGIKTYPTFEIVEE